MVWRYYKKELLVFAAGVGVFATFTSQTSENLTRYLQAKGYSQIVVDDAGTSCGKGSTRYGFQAVSPDAKSVRGTVCMGAYPMFYLVNERVR